MILTISYSFSTAACFMFIFGTVYLWKHDSGCKKDHLLKTCSVVNYSYFTLSVGSVFFLVGTLLAWYDTLKPSKGIYCIQLSNSTRYFSFFIIFLMNKTMVLFIK